MEFKEYDKNGYIKWERIYQSYEEVKDKDLPNWFKEYLLHIGEKYKNVVGKVFTLVGMSETNEDYYYVVRDSEGKRYFESCVGKIIPVK